MRLIITCFFSLVFSYAHSQIGFNNVYDFGAPGATFKNILIQGDTIITFGSASVGSLHQWGILMAKLDTFGHVLEYKIHVDTQGDDYIIGTNNGIIRTQDGGYAFVANLFQRDAGIMMKLDYQGDPLFIQEYSDTNVTNIAFRKIVETSDGFLLGGNKTYPGNIQKIFLLKTDQLGNAIWEKLFGGDNELTFMGNLIKINENTFMIGGGRRSTIDTPVSDLWSRSKLIAIDSLGNIKWEWESQLEEKEAGIVGLNPSTDSGWLYATTSTHFINELQWVTQSKIVKLNEALEQEWKEDYGEPTSFLNGFNDIKPLSNDDWFAVGQISAEGGLLGWRLKISETGEVVWNHLDTALIDQIPSSENYLTGAGLLSSGNIISCGYTLSIEPELKNFAWLVKTNTTGCIVPNCDLTSTFSPLLQPTLITVYPNPTTDYFKLQFKNSIPYNSILTLNNTLGEVVLEQQLSTLKEIQEFNIKYLPSGVYYYSIHSEGKILTTNKLVISKR